jgi:hypothetical protein
LTPPAGYPPNGRVDKDSPASDTIESRDPTLPRWSSHRLLAVVAIVLGVVAIGSTLAAAHYHQQITRLKTSVSASSGPSPSAIQTPAQTPTASATVRPESPPPLILHSYDLGTVGQLRVTVDLTTASADGIGSTKGQLLITALVRGGRPGTTYRLDGGDCQTNASVVWAQGVADATGTALLTGKDWTLPKANPYYLGLDASPPAASTVQSELGGIEGNLVLGQASQYDAGGQPCN